MAVEEARGDASLTRNEVTRQKASFELDLIAFFKVMQDEISDALADAVAEGLDGDAVIARVDAVFEE